MPDLDLIKQEEQECAKVRKMFCQLFRRNEEKGDTAMNYLNESEH